MNIKKISLILLCLCPFLAQGQGYQVALQGAKQLGMGHTGAAMASDASTLFFNPGATAMVKGNSASVNFSPIFSNTEYVDNATFSAARTDNPVGTPFSVYAAFGSSDSSKFISRFKFGIAVYTPFGSGVKWGESWIGRAALSSISLSSIFVQPTVSFKITDKLSFGIGFVYVRGSVNLQRSILFPSLASVGGEGKVELDGKANNFGFNAGLFFKPSEKFSIGVSYRSKVTASVSNGSATFSNIPAIFASRFPAGGTTNFSANLPLPAVLNVGVSFSPNKKLTISAEMNHIGWSAYDSLIFDYTDANFADTKSARKYQDIVVLRLGGQYMVTDALAARLGFYYGNTPVTNGHVTPETPDSDRMGYTAGLGYKIGKMDIDFAVAFINTEKRKDTNSETQLNGTFQTKAFVPSISLGYSF
ncbi:MAG: long-chain fatty acid transporter permease [Bacteroidetes bacterium]|nr:MAG: long-chain fatty acid transporter permease [Bacteroidota bacterium]